MLLRETVDAAKLPELVRVLVQAMGVLASALGR